jgi:hypothetical protein
MKAASISMADAMASLTIEVTITRKREWAARIWLGGVLLRAAALVMGCGISVDVTSRAPLTACPCCGRKNAAVGLPSSQGDGE